MIGAMLATAILLVSPGLSGPSDDYEPTSPRWTSFEGRLPFAVLEVWRPSRMRTETLGLYTGPLRQMTIRRITPAGNRTNTISWVSAASCPGAASILHELEDLPVPMIDVPHYGRSIDNSEDVVLDGARFKLWAQRPVWTRSTAYGVEVESNLGTPLAQWAERLKQVLEPCWTDREPTASSR